MARYYKCIKNKDHENVFTLGKIYEALNPNNLEQYGNFIDDTGNRNGFSGLNHKHFEPVDELIVEEPKEDYSYLIPFIEKLNKTK